ncbi:MAG: DUF192 domain-containing protein [Candidatus Micrarchaeota archaeon]
MEKISIAKIENQTKNSSVSTFLEICNTFSSRARGLMFRKSPASLLFEFDYPDRHAIHSFFVSFPFDAIYLDENWQITDIFNSISPFTSHISPRANSKYLLELPIGYSQKLNANIGDKLNLVRDKNGKFK